MKLSIWQQFSSNHSAMYTVIGEFASADEAARTADYLRRVMREIDTCNVGNPFPNAMTPVEERVAREHGIDWGEPLDWLTPRKRSMFVDWYRREPEEFVILIDRLVVVDALGGSMTWQTGHQFADLFRALGATTYSDVYMGFDPVTQADVYSEVRIRAVLTAEDSSVIDQAVAQIERHHAHAAIPNAPPLDSPWIPYLTTYARYTGGMASEVFAGFQRAYLESPEAFAAYCVDHPVETVKLQPTPMDAMTILHQQATWSDYHFPTWERQGNTLRFEGGGIGFDSPLCAYWAWAQSLGGTLTFELKET